MLVDCDTCSARGAACTDCPMHALLTMPAVIGHLTGEDQEVLEIFARGGFEVEVLEAPARKPLRLVPRRRQVA